MSEILIHALDFKVVFTVYSAMKENSLQINKFSVTRVYASFR